LDSTEAPLLHVDGLGKLYGDLRAVDALSFEVRAGEIVGLVGPNGLAGILPATRGAIRVAGFDLSREPVAAKRELAFVPDEPRLFEYLTAMEHLNLVARLYGVRDWEQRGRALFEELELRGKEKALPGELSRGMRQKLTIACGLLHAPKVILLDEPLTGLDPIAIRNMKRSLKERARGGAALLLSSHLLPLVEELCHKVLVIAGGRRVAFGSLDEIRAQLRSEEGEASLEDLFVRITAAAPTGGPEPA
jgi:ABC-2 type transport system ATP-binding protein